MTGTGDSIDYKVRSSSSKITFEELRTQASIYKMIKPISIETQEI